MTTTAPATIPELVAEVIADALRSAEAGHCVRVNHLDAKLAREVIQQLVRQPQLPMLTTKLLAAEADHDPLTITADRAVEIRNRKQGNFCLFIPAGEHDATASSLGNSFAELNGPALIEEAYRRFRNTTGDTVRSLLRAVQQAFATVNTAFRPTPSDLLALAIVAQDYDNRGNIEAVGAELWRVNLIPDAGADFQSRLVANRNAVRDIARPNRITLSVEERVDGLKLTDDAARRVKRALRGRQLHDVKRWTQDIGVSFDAWTPVENPEPADCNSVTLVPFVDPSGALDPKATGLTQEAVATPLFAHVGERKKLLVRWITEPKNTNVPRWRIEMVPAGEHAVDGYDMIELPWELKRGSQKRASLSLDFGDVQPDDLPQAAMRVRVSGVSESGAELQNQRGEPLVAESDEFYLSLDQEPPLPEHERRRSASTLAEGMLRAVVQFRASPGDIDRPQWTQGATTTSFSMRATLREAIALTFSAALDALQLRTLELPDSLGIWALQQIDLSTVLGDRIVPLDPPPGEASEEKRFRQARRQFFSTLREQEVRHRVEVAAWDDALVDLAVRYVRAWAKWLDTAGEDDLRTALSVDTLHLRVGDGEKPLLEAAVVLPTHPLRAIWFAGHATLLHTWMEQLDEVKASERSRRVDLEMIASILPTNVPALAHHPAAAEPFVFYRNLDAGHGVAFPVASPDPAAQLATLSTLFGLGNTLGEDDRSQAERAAATLDRFQLAHPYADPFRLALVNPGNGALAAEALGQWTTLLQKRQPDGGADPDGALTELPGLAIIAYPKDDTARADLSQLGGRRRIAEEAETTQDVSDHLRPSLAVVVRPATDLRQAPPATPPRDEHHLAIIQDLSKPQPAVLEIPATPAGLGVHGLVARYASAGSVQPDGVAWHHWIETAGGATPHPTKRQLSDSLLDGHRAANGAAARLLDPRRATVDSARAGLTVQITPDDLALLDTIHHGADWVLTVDRFIGADLFDTPNDTTLASDRPTYILDAAPDFADGLGHRTLVTTASRHEVEAIVLRAMGKFGFLELKESVGALIHTLKTISGRLLLDALRADSRAAEVVALGAVIAWLQATGKLRDAIIVPVDPHQDLFRPTASDGAIGQQRCDLMLARFPGNRAEFTFVEVKGRSDLSDLESLAESMAAQMESTATVVERRCFSDDTRVDGVLQRASLTQALQFYLARAQRYRLVDDAVADDLAKRLNSFERGPQMLTIKQHGYVVALGVPPARSRFDLDDRTVVEVLTIPRIAAETNGAFEVATPPVDGPTTESADRLAADPPEQGVVVARELPHAPHGQSSTEPASAATDTTSKPITTLSLEQEHELPSSTDAPAPVTALPVDQDVILGDANGTPVTWQPRVSGSPHLFILGIPGQGKSVSTERILIELARTGTPALVLDFHGTFADLNGRYAKLAKPVILDAARGLPFSPFAIDPRSSWNEVLQHARGIADVIDHVFGLGEIQADVVYTTLRDLYRRRGFSDVDDDAPLPLPPTMTDVQRALERRANEAGVRNVIARTRSLFDFDLFKPAGEADPSFESLLAGGLVVALHRLGGEELGLALAAFLLRTLYLSMTHRPIADRIQLVVVLDEAHKLARDVTLPKLMKEGRKYGVAIVAASQGLADFHADVVNNAGTRVSFRINHPDSRKVGGFFRTRSGQSISEQLERLRVGEALVQTPEMPWALRAEMRRATD